jgi:methyl-accepting chemotaxis protein
MIEKLSEISSAIAAAVEEQGAATQEIFRNVQQSAGLVQHHRRAAWCDVYNREMPLI